MTFLPVKILGFLFLFTFIHCTASEETVATDDATVNVKPTETTETKSEAEVKSSTEESSKPVEETPKSVEETVKPVEEIVKPVEETVKPVEEAPKPVEETVKPAEETVKVTEEAAKPADETEKKSDEKDDSHPEVEGDMKTGDNSTDEDDIGNEMEENLVRMMEEYASGKLDKGEMDKRFQEYRSKIQEDIQGSFQAHKNEIWGNLGKKENDTVTWDEYLRLAYPPDTIPEGEKLDDVTSYDKGKFESHDADKDGKLNFQEFQNFFSAVMDSKMPDFSFEKMLQEFMGNETADSLNDGPEESGEDADDEKDVKADDSKPVEENKATVEETKTDASPESTEQKKEEVKTETTSTPSEGIEAKHEEL